MDSESIKAVLLSIKSGKISVDKALKKLRDLPYEDLHCAKIDHHRHLRQGIPEVLLAEGKKTEDVVAIAHAMYRKSGRILITRANEDVFKKLKIRNSKYHHLSGVIAAGGARTRRGNVLVVSAGTSDAPVADEAARTAEFLGSRVSTIIDVGVAGIHRLMDQRNALGEARVVVVVAGMEGALPSVVGGLIDRPIVAVPTSVGYGTSLGGLTALFAMLNSCVPGIAVMNIDNGFGAGCLAHKINTL